jgi:hypothetical protein
MSTRVTSFPKKPRSEPTEWARWADGDRHELTRGADFPQTILLARKAFIAYASRHGMHSHTVYVEGDDEHLWVQAYPRGTPRPLVVPEEPAEEPDTGTWIDGIRVPDPRVSR